MGIRRACSTTSTGSCEQYTKQPHPSTVVPMALEGISREFLPFVRGKTCVSAYRKVFPGVGAQMPIENPTAFEEWWTKARTGDSVAFSDGSRYAWQGGHERYFPSNSDDKEALRARGLAPGTMSY